MGKAREKQAKTRENRRKQAKNGRFFGANFWGGKLVGANFYAFCNYGIDTLPLQPLYPTGFVKFNLSSSDLSSSLENSFASKTILVFYLFNLQLQRGPSPQPNFPHFPIFLQTQFPFCSNHIFTTLCQLMISLQQVQGQPFKGISLQG